MRRLAYGGCCWLLLSAGEGALLFLPAPLATGGSTSEKLAPLAATPNSASSAETLPSHLPWSAECGHGTSALCGSEAGMSKTCLRQSPGGAPHAGGVRKSRPTAASAWASGGPPPALELLPLVVPATPPAKRMPESQERKRWASEVQVLFCRWWRWWCFEGEKRDEVRVENEIDCPRRSLDRTNKGGKLTFSSRPRAQTARELGSTRAQTRGEDTTTMTS